MRLFTSQLRRADVKSAESVDAFIANSSFVAERIKCVYGRLATVIYPPVDTTFFSKEGGIGDLPPTLLDRPYYLYAGELRDYKRPDLAVEACLRMNRRLVVVGNGIMKKPLLRRIGDGGSIMFLGRVSDAALRAIFQHAQALLLRFGQQK